MRKITFKGTESERSIYCSPGTAPSIKRALEARGYTTDVGAEMNPWQEVGAEREQMIAVTGRLSKTESGGLLFLTDDEDSMDAAWEAIHLYFPDGRSDAMRKLDRPA
jgi:hypothetical protein